MVCRLVIFVSSSRLETQKFCVDDHADEVHPQRMFQKLAPCLVVTASQRVGGNRM
jgi:hypothetical protein